jgi:hypothetical protein
MTALQYMGYCLINNGEYERALPILNRCLSIRRDNLPEDHIDLAIGEFIVKGIVLLKVVICSCRNGRTGYL